jgi:uroporphyrinogen decarboxylase
MRADISGRERVRLALQHVATDRVPVDLMATAESWERLQAYLGLPDREAVMRHLGIDIRHPRMLYQGPPVQRLDTGGFLDAWGITWVPVPYPGGVYHEVGDRPLAKIKDAAELNDYPWPDPSWWDVESLVEQIRAWDQEGEYAICLDEFGDPGGFFEISQYLRGMELLLEDMALRPEIPTEIMGHVAEFFGQLAERVLTRLGDRVDLIWTSDDIAHQHGLLVSLPMWQGLIRPHHERFNRRVHALGGRIMYHSCGAVALAVAGLIEAGVDVLDALQFSADGMDPRDLKLRFGDRLAFHGGLDVQHKLPRGSPESVRDDVRELISVLGAGGGYILAPTHNIQVDTPPENIVAAYDAAGSIRTP